MTSQEIPADEVSELYPVTLNSTDGSPLLNISFSSRGVQKLTISEEPDLDWVYQGDYSAWDYTEWHWWKGHPFDFEAQGHDKPAYWQSFRPRFWGNPQVHAEKLAQGYLRIDFASDGFQFSQDYLLPGQAEPDVGYWDMLFTVTNSTGKKIEEYGHFFACYTSVNGENSYWFWDAGGELVLWKDREAGHLNGYVSSSEAYFQPGGSIPHCPRGKGRIIGAWRHPVLVSHASPEGWRSVILLDPDTTGGVADSVLQLRVSEPWVASVVGCRGLPWTSSSTQATRSAFFSPAAASLLICGTSWSRALAFLPGSSWRDGGDSSRNPGPR